jgi:RNA polymerase sigma factor (TIGR02999 family)
LIDAATDTTLLISAARAGDKLAEARLFERVYSDLHRLAQRQLRAANGVPEHATSLVHEVYLRLAHNGLELNDRRHFFAVASRAMRQIVVDHARARLADKRGAGVEPVPFDSALDVAAAGSSEQVLQVDAALQRLTEVDPQLAHLVELRFFGGLKFDELSRATGVSERSLKRAWTKARAFLYREMAQAVP